MSNNKGFVLIDVLINLAIVSLMALLLSSYMQLKCTATSNATTKLEQSNIEYYDFIKQIEPWSPKEINEEEIIEDSTT